MLLSFVYSLPPVMFLPADLLMSMALLTSSNESTQDTTDTSTTPNTPRTQASLIMILFDCLLRSVVFMMPPIVIIALFAVFPTDQVAVALGCMVSLWCLTCYTINSPPFKTMIIPESIMICHSTYFYGCMVVMITQLDMGIVPADAGFWPGKYLTDWQVNFYICFTLTVTRSDISVDCYEVVYCIGCIGETRVLGEHI